MDNPILISLFLFVVGLIVLYFGGEGLVKGSSQLARALGINPILIGLTIVAFGTSAPELVVSILASLKGSNELIVGNIIGSNISNIGLILAISSLIYPISIKLSIIKIELPFMIMLSIVLLLLCQNSVLDRPEGLVLFMFLISMVIYSCFDAFREPKEVKKEFDEFVGVDKNYARNAVYIIAGLVGLSIGAKLLVDSAISIAEGLGVSEAIIGITAVAIGTSLPELTTSVIAAMKKESGIIIGNIIGSNIFNIGIVGIVSALHPISIDHNVVQFEFYVMILFSIILFPIMRTGFKITKTEGLVLLLMYFLFLRFVF